MARDEVEFVQITQPHLAIASTKDVHIVVEDVGCVELALGGHVFALDGLPINLNS